MQWTYLCLFFILAVALTSAVLQQEGNLSHTEYFNMARDHTISIKVENNNQSRPTAAPGILSKGYSRTYLTFNLLLLVDLSKYGKAVQDGAEWCRSQGGTVEEYQYSYISREAKVVGFGKTRLMCSFGVYTLIDVETLASPYLTLAQSSYINPLDNWKWDKKRFANLLIICVLAYPYIRFSSPALQYCLDNGGASTTTFYIEKENTCKGAGWSPLPAETSPGLSNNCDFTDGSTIDQWALFNGLPISTAKRLNPHFRYQGPSQRCRF